MRWGLVFAVTTIVLFIFLFEKRRLKPEQKKEKWSLIILLAICWLLAIFVHPNVPGPTTLIETIFKPLVKLLES